MELWQKRSLDLISALSKPGSKNPSVIPYTPQKTQISGEEKRYFKRVRAERVGVSSKRLSSMLLELEAEPRANIHSLMVIKDGVVISECSAPGYDINTFHLSHSMSKTVTGMAVGLLIDDGLLDVETRVSDIFPELKYKDKRFKKMTVDHLLSMTSGSTFNEVGSITDSKWLEAFFSSPLLFEPGRDFAYNSMNSYVLAAIVKSITGRELIETVEERIFAPLEIENYFWERSPEGTEKGGWGVYLSAESWAKLGYMMLSGGEFFGRRILNKETVSKMTTAQGIPHDSSGDFNYGYHIWVNKKNDEFLFNGMLGQNVWVCPENQIVLSINAGNNELFQQSPAMAIIRKHLGGAFLDSTLPSFDYRGLCKVQKSFLRSVGWARPKRAAGGLAVRLGFREQYPFDEAWNSLIGREFGFRKNHVGLLPLFVRCMQNNLDAGIESIRFYREENSLWLSVRENGVDYNIEAGLYGYKYTELEFRGERYLAALMAEAVIDEDKKPLFKLELIFPELPNTRRIKISEIDAHRLLIRFSEMPDNNIATSLLESFPVTNPKLTFAINLLEKQVGSNFISSKLESAFTPSFVSADKNSPLYSSIIEEEERRAEETSRVMKTVHSIIAGLTRELDKETEEEELKVKSRSIVGTITERIKSKFKGPRGVAEIKDTELANEVASALVNTEENREG